RSLGRNRGGVCPGVAHLATVTRDLEVMDQHCPPRAHAIERSLVQSRINNQFNDSQSLMYLLMQYRHEPIHSKMLKIRDKYSMLHLDVLILIYHFSKICSDNILEF